MNTALTSGLLGYGLLLSTASAALFQWKLRSRHSRPPVGFKLLRGPGELSLRALRRIESRLPLLLLGGVLLPLFVSLALILYAPLLDGALRLIALILGWAGFGTLVFYYGRHVYRELNRRRDLELRYLGERAVAEELAPLLAQGYRLFHDVAIHGIESELDLDHILVGPNGVAAIESETRQRDTGKGANRDHEVTFDGKQLVWPWGTDRDTVGNIEGECASFSKWLLQTTGYRIQATALLTIPGWWVNITGRGIVTVANHKQVLAAATAREDTFLSPEQIEKICRELELHCRDVEC